MIFSDITRQCSYQYNEQRYTYHRILPENWQTWCWKIDHYYTNVFGKNILTQKCSFFIMAKICQHKNVRFLVYICSLRPSDAYMRQWFYIHCSRSWLVDLSVPSHYMNQCCNIVDWTVGDKFQWNFKQNSNILIHENSFENVICEMAAILSREMSWSRGALVSLCIMFQSTVQGGICFWTLAQCI